MSFYNILRESAVQAPDEIGNDLDQIEKDIFEDRDDDTDIANNGVLNDNTDDFDPVSEGYHIMYESLYNYNQLMRAIGLHELNEAYNGRELILEASDVKTWFNKIIESIKNAFKKVAKMFKTVIDKLNFAASADKQFVEKYKDILEKNKDIEWEFEGYKYPNIRDAIGAVKKLSKELEKKIVVPADAFSNDTKEVTISMEPLDDGKVSYEKIYDIINGNNGIIKIIDSMNMEQSTNLVNDFLDNNRDTLTADTTKEFSNKMLEIFRGGKEKTKITGKDDGFDVDSLKAFLTTNRDLKYINDAYKTVKSQYDELLKKINDLQNNIKNETEYPQKNDLKLKVCDVFVTYARLMNNYSTAANSVMMKCARERRSQAKAVLKKIIATANEANSANSTEAEQPAKHESVFARLR